MDRLWTRLASHANDAKPFRAGFAHPVNWRRCLYEFSTALIYCHAGRPPVSQAELDKVATGIRKLLGLFATIRGRSRSPSSSYVNGRATRFPARCSASIATGDIVKSDWTGTHFY